MAATRAHSASRPSPPKKAAQPLAARTFTRRDEKGRRRHDGHRMAMKAPSSRLKARVSSP